MSLEELSTHYGKIQEELLIRAVKNSLSLSMNTQFRPMLACACQPEQFDTLTYPVIVTDKIDGIRCITLEEPNGSNLSVPVSRNLKRIRNDHIFEQLSKHAPSGLDGELVVPGKFSEVSSAVMNSAGTPDFTYWVFDWLPIFCDPRYAKGVSVGYEDRIEKLLRISESFPTFIKVLPWTYIDNPKALRIHLETRVKQGYEGICFRTPWGYYKFGRSTLREQWLMKCKALMDAEARVIGFIEKFINNNEPEVNALGYQERSTHQENMIPAACLGALMVEDEKGRRFNIGSGFDDFQRDEIWANQDKYIGRQLTFTYQEFGTKDLPRCPVFKGWREVES